MPEEEKTSHIKLLQVLCEAISASRAFQNPVIVGLSVYHGWVWVYPDSIDDFFAPVLTIKEGKATPYDPERIDLPIGKQKEEN